jgi:hypothetical protein
VASFIEFFQMAMKLLGACGMILRSKKHLLVELKAWGSFSPVRFVGFGWPHERAYSASDSQYGNSTSHLFPDQGL